MFDAFEHGEDGKVSINMEKCVGCGACIDACKLEKLAENKDVVPVLVKLRLEHAASTHYINCVSEKSRLDNSSLSADNLFLP